MKWIATAAAALVVAHTQALAQDELSFWDVERRVIDQLVTTDVTALASSVSGAPKTTDAAELLVRLEVLVRAGHDAATVAALDALRAAGPRLPTHVAGDLVNALIDREERALALAAFERFPDAPAGWCYVLLKDWAAEVGWEAVDRWAAQRQAAAPEIWLRQRLELRADMGKAKELFDELVADARAHPADLERFLLLARLRGHVLPTPDLEWMAEAFAPRLAFDAARLGQELRERAAVLVLERALAMPVTDEDVTAVRDFSRMHHCMAMPSEDPVFWKAWLHASIRNALLQAYHRSGDAAKAQALMVALADEQPEHHGLPSISLFMAGEVQAASGARVIEGRVRAPEEEQRDSPEYWKGRADYYKGRREVPEALDALDRALELTPFEKSPAGRYFLIFDRARLLPSSQGAAFLREELARMPADSEYAIHTLAQLISDWPESILADDPLAWRHLGASSDWYVNEERILMLLAEKARLGGLKAFWIRAEELARAGPVARAATLGDVARRLEDFPRVVALLAATVDGMPSGETRDRAALTLFEAYRELSDWRRAESIWPLARRRLTPREEVRWLGELAVAQAKAGAADEAMRTWARAANLDRRELQQLANLADAGLRDRLIAFYADIARRDPPAEPFVRRVLADLKAR